MKKLLFLLLTACALSSAATIQVSAPAVVAGSTFDVAVDVSNVFANFPGEAVTGFGFNVTVGSPLVTFTGATVNSTFFDDLSGCCLGTDVVGIANISFPAGVEAGNFVEPLLLATLHFSGTGTGPTTVGVIAHNSVDPNQGLFFLSGAENFVNSQPITVSSPVPEPSTMLISGLGLAGLFILRRRLDR